MYVLCMHVENIYVCTENLTALDRHGGATRMYHCALGNITDWGKDSDESRTVSGSEFQRAGLE